MCGADQLPEILGKSDYVTSVLPSTSDTENLFDLGMFKNMKKGSMFINVGRGSLVVEDDLIEALDAEYLRHAVLDVCQVEPLPESDAMWHHSGITIIPHVSGWDLDDGLKVVEKNYRRLCNGDELLNEINRDAGY